MKKAGLGAGAAILGFLAIVVVITLVWVMNTYNGLVELRIDTDGGWAQVETQYQRRADLIPQLVATVQGAADFEEDVLTAVTEARTNWLDTSSSPTATIDDEIAASSQFDSALSRLLLTVENYPTLTATEGFLTLQSQLEGTENRVAVARKDYNELVTVYNTAIQVVPAKLVATWFSFDLYPFFEAQEGAEEAPEVEFE